MKMQKYHPYTLRKLARKGKRCSKKLNCKWKNQCKGAPKPVTPPLRRSARLRR